MLHDLTGYEASLPMEILGWKPVEKLPVKRRGNVGDHTVKGEFRGK